MSSSVKRTVFKLSNSFFQSPIRSFQSKNGFSAAYFTTVPKHSEGNLKVDVCSTRAKETTNTGGESNRDEKDESGVIGFVVDKAKEGTIKATETVRGMGGKTKETMDKAWDVTKETARNIEHAVAGDDSAEAKPTEPKGSSIDDLRKRAGWYDLRE